MEVTYRVRRGDLWRVAAHANTHHPHALMYMLLPSALVLLNVAAPLLRGDFLNTFLILLRLGVILSLITLVVMAFGVYRRMPSQNTERFCTERVGPYGFECLIPEGHRYAAWQDVLKITETSQDLFVFAKKGRTYIIPKHAFSGPEQAQAFLQAAETYRNDAKRCLPPPPQEGVWPRAPRTGDFHDASKL